MPALHLPSTPERLISSLRRSDSKDPSTTCRGLTKAGKQCRNPLKLSLASAAGSPGSGTGGRGELNVNDEAQDGVVTVGDKGEVVFYCWRHKDQAAISKIMSMEQSEEPEHKTHKPRPPTNVVKLEARTSVDTLVERLGGLNFGGDNHNSGKTDDTDNLRRRRRETQERSKAERNRRSLGFWSSLCCVSDQETDSLIGVRPRPHKPVKQTKSSSVASPSIAALPTPSRPSPHYRRIRPPLSQTQTLLSHIPPNLSPHTVPALVIELAKPLSERDEEGYIYIFWLQDATSAPDRSSDSSLLSLPQTPQARRGRRTSEIVRQASVSGPRTNNADGSPKILLKIGRASNVHRRMHEWARQCGYIPTLIRWYPYVPNSSTVPSPTVPYSTPRSRRQSASSPRIMQSAPASPNGAMATTTRKVPHVHRVERLIHVELGDHRVMQKCKACGREHREWFEVEATRKGVKMVDGVVRRWVQWAEGTS